MTTYTYTNADNTSIVSSDGRCIPVCPGNRDYDELVAAGTEIAAYVEPEPDYKTQAQAALDKSDTTVLRCVSAGITVPADWQAYRVALRSIVASGVGPLPVMPGYPAGS